MTLSSRSDGAAFEELASIAHCHSGARMPAYHCHWYRAFGGRHSAASHWTKMLTNSADGMHDATAAIFHRVNVNEPIQLPI